jgi:hypothetical protein
MQKVVVIIAVFIMLTGCARNTYKRDVHPEYGVGTKDNKHYQKAATDCRDAEYSKGIIIDGELVKDIAIIKKYEDEYTDWMIDAAIAAAYSPGSGAYAGATAAVAVTTGNTSSLNTTNSSSTSMAPTPEKYQDLKRSRNERRNCLVKKGWVKEQ